jgi:hypothetical protein
MAVGRLTQPAGERPALAGIFAAKPTPPQVESGPLFFLVPLFQITSYSEN